MQLRIALSLITLALMLCIGAFFVMLVSICNDCGGSNSVMYYGTVTVIRATNNAVVTFIAGTQTAIAKTAEAPSLITGTANAQSKG